MTFARSVRLGRCVDYVRAVCVQHSIFAYRTYLALAKVNHTNGELAIGKNVGHSGNRPLERLALSPRRGGIHKYVMCVREVQLY